MHGHQAGLLLVLTLLALVAASCSQPSQEASEAEPSASETASAPRAAEGEAEPAEADDVPESGSTTTYSFEEDTVDGALDKPPAADPAPTPEAETIEPAAGAPMAPGSSAGGGSSAAPAGGSAMPPVTAYAHSEELPPPPPPPPPPVAAPTAMPPASANGHGASTASVPKNGHGGSKVLSYFQKSRTHIDTRRAFGFVLMPKVAVSDEDKRAQKSFCTIVLASMDFMTPGAVASAPRAVLATYWPIVASRASFEISDAFARRDCDELIAWYDHGLARSLATKAGVAELSGPLLITWPSSGAGGEAARDPLIVDFSKANHARATKALQYWFRQLKARPDLWTSRIREGTIRAELADAVNDTAGVMLAVLSGKWDSLTVVASASP